MKILQVCPGYFPGIGGVEQHVRNIGERLAREHQVTVFAADPSGNLLKEEQIDGVLVRRFKSFSPNNAYHISFQMLRELRRSEFDIVHGHSYHALPLFFSRYAKRRKFIVTAHYHGRGHTRIRDFMLKLYKPFGRKVFQEADRIIAVSNFEKSLLLKDFRVPEAKIEVIPSGVALDEFTGLKKEDKGYKVILWTGRLEEYKGVQHVVRALPLLDESSRLEIVGRGPYKKKLLKLAAELGVGNRIEFYQDLPRKELLDRYANADLFVMLSRHEAFGIAVAEALAAKTPCIVASTSALREWVDNENCFGIDYPIDLGELAELINKVIGKNVGDVKLWDWEQVVAETVKVYKEGL
jgi:glycosyltransferase involved in cell wall biosynthesis